MDELIEEIRAAVRGGAWRIALAGVMTLPDICAVLESTEGGAGKRYRDWWEENMAGSQLLPRDAWLMRNGLIHEGRSGAGQYSRVLFIKHPTFMLHNSIFNDALILDMPRFTEEVIAAVRAWTSKFEQSSRYQERIGSLMRWHPNGVSPYVDGFPTLG